MNHPQETAAPLTAQEGAAGLMVAAAQVDGAYTEVERDAVTKAMMRLFQLASPAAAALREAGEEALTDGDQTIRFAEAARGLDADMREKLLGRVWQTLEANTGECDPQAFAYRIADCWAMPRDRARALRPATAE